MARLTLRLPEDLHRTLRECSQRTGSSLNELIVVALRDSLGRNLTDDGPDTLDRQRERLRQALGDLVEELHPALFPEAFFPTVPLPDVDRLREMMPVLDPPLSATVIAQREENR